MLPNSRKVVGLVFTENQPTEVVIPRGFLESRMLLSGTGLDTISVGGTSVRPRGTPIQMIQVLEGQKTLHSMRPVDLLHFAEVFEQAALAAMVTPIPGVTVAAHPFSYDLPLLFEEPFSADPLVTALASWMYENLIFRVTWGGHAQLAVGGTGVVTQSSTQLTAIGNQFSQDELPAEGPYVWAMGLGRTLSSYKETAAPAAVNAEFPIELARTADIRAIGLLTLDANGEPVNTIVTDITLEVNNNLRQFAGVPFRALRSDNAKTYGVTMPPGLAILDFAADKDIARILEATGMAALNLILGTAAVAGTIRTWTRRIERAAA